MDNANIQAILNVYMYVSHHAPQADNTSFGVIVDKLVDYMNRVNSGAVAKPDGWESDERKIMMLKEAVANDSSLASITLVHMRPESDWGAAAFMLPDGTVSFVYRGTAAGEWIDNAIPLSGLPHENKYYIYDSNGNIIDTIVVTEDHASPQQAEALNWFNKICAENGWGEDTHIIVSGHSKGGNKAQFITINSALVDECYNFDGQGFSPEAIAMFQEKFGDEYQERLQKMYTYAAYNDYVNLLGITVVPSAHIYYLDATLGEDNMADFHHPEAYLQPDGKFNKPYAGGTTGHQGEIGELLRNVNKVIMDLPPEMREPIVYGVMGLMQSFHGNAINGEEVSLGTTVLGTAGAVSLLITHLIGTKDGREALVELVKLYSDDVVDGMVGFFNGIGEKYGMAAECAAVLAAVGIAWVAAPLILKVLGFVVNVAVFTGTVLTLCSMLYQFGQEIYSTIKKFSETIINIYSSWLNKWFAGGNNNASLQQAVAIDTGLLKDLAQKIANINSRVADIDRRMDRLYWKVGLRDLWSLLQADILTGHSWRLSRCQGYLIDTANDFEYLEHSISNSIGG